MDSGDDVWIVLAADARYAGPLAVALRSIDEHLSGTRRVTAVVLATAIDPATRVAATDGLRRLEVRWHAVDVARHDGLPVPTDHMTMAAYHRLLLAEALPADVERAVYLDVDVLVGRDVAELAAVPLEGRLLGGCPDVGAPRLGSPIGLPGWRELGLDPRATYLNTGVLVIDVRQWRETGVAAAIAAYLAGREQSGEAVLWADQDGFNALASDRWHELDLRWNAQNQLVLEDCWADAFLPPGDLAAARADPWIIHFSHTKPWDEGRGASPWGALWWEVADRISMPATPPLPARSTRYARAVRLRLGGAAAALRGV